MPQSKRCITCGGNYLLIFFRRSVKANSHHTIKPWEPDYQDRCIGCEALIKHDEPIDRRLRRKAIAARRRHGAKLKELGIIGSEDELEDMYGWSLDRMIDGIKHVMEKGCTYCGQPVKTAEEGLGAITLDIFNTDLLPHYSTNVRWCCSNCNSEKQRTSPDIWGARQSMWHRWYVHQVRLGADPEAFGFFSFDENKVDQPPLW